MIHFSWKDKGEYINLIYHLQLGRRRCKYTYKMKNRNFIIFKFPVPDIWNFHDKKKKKKKLGNRRGENFLPSFSCFIVFCMFFFSPVSLFPLMDVDVDYGRGR